MYISPDLVSQRLSEQLQQQVGFPAVGAVVKQTEHQHLHEGGGATLRHQEDQLSQVQGLSLKHNDGYTWFNMSPDQRPHLQISTAPTVLG